MKKDEKKILAHNYFQGLGDQVGDFVRKTICFGEDFNLNKYKIFEFLFKYFYFLRELRNFLCKVIIDNL